MSLNSLPQDILDIIIKEYTNIINAHWETIKERLQTNWIFHFEIKNVVRIYDELLRLQYEVNPSIVPEGYNKVQCAVHNQLYDLKVVPMTITYCDLAPNPPQWLLDLATRINTKYNANANF